MLWIKQTIWSSCFLKYNSYLILCSNYFLWAYTFIYKIKICLRTKNVWILLSTIWWELYSLFNCGSAITHKSTNNRSPRNILVLQCLYFCGSAITHESTNNRSPRNILVLQCLYFFLSRSPLECFIDELADIIFKHFYCFILF